MNIYTGMTLPATSKCIRVKYSIDISFLRLGASNLSVTARSSLLSDQS